MRSMELRQVRITCYLTWSPCPNCARQLAAFKKDHPDLILRIYTSRLYFYWRKKFQKGLCTLWRSGIHLDVMDLSRKKGPRPPVGKGFPASIGQAMARRIGEKLDRKEGCFGSVEAKDTPPSDWADSTKRVIPREGKVVGEGLCTAWGLTGYPLFSSQSLLTAGQTL